MRFDLHTHETILLLAGVVGLVEQELARILFDLPPSSLLTGGFVTLALASVGLASVRHARRSGGNGEST